MSSFLQFAVLLIIILITAKAAGYLSTRLNQPSVLGELLVGLLLGPSLLDLYHTGFVTDTHAGEMITHLGDLGVLLLMFLAGLELHLNELAKSLKVSAFAGTLGVLVPVLLGYLVGHFTGLSFESSVFLGLTLGATSVSISAQTLMEMKVLRSRVGLGLLGSAVFDDVLVLLLLSGFLALQSGGSFIEILIVVGKMILYLALSIGVGLWLLPAIIRRIGKLRITEGLVTTSIVIMLIYGVAAEVLGGMAAITGAFIAGLMFARTAEKGRIDNGLHSIAYAFFVPIFFVNIGLLVNLRELQVSDLLLVLITIVAAVIGKILGSGIGAKLANFSLRESLQLGIGMVSRGEVGLIIGSAGLTAGLLSNRAFSAIIGTVLVTTLITPILLRLSFHKGKPDMPAVAADSSKSKEAD